ncbi:MAG: DUF3386 family protein [Thermomicrobiales bacterium]|nr:DUF3386 family protein [Thermomicrobiales bacterium]
MSSTITNQPEAHELLRNAHEKSYRFPKTFAGFSADIEVFATGVTARGSVDITGPRYYTLDIDAPSDLVDWVKSQLGSMVGHRWARSYDEGDGKYDMVLEEDGDPRGALVRQLNDPFTSSYRVRDNAISVVNRTMGSTSFSISMQTHVQASDGRSLPEAFTVSYRNTETNTLERSEIFRDTYGVVDGVDVPLERRVSLSDGNGVTERMFKLSNIKLHG